MAGGSDGGLLPYRCRVLPTLPTWYLLRVLAIGSRPWRGSPARGWQGVSEAAASVAAVVVVARSRSTVVNGPDTARFGGAVCVVRGHLARLPDFTASARQRRVVAAR